MGVKVAVDYYKAGIYGPETGDEKGNGELEPKSIQPIVTNKKVTVVGSNMETLIERILIILVKDVQIK